MATLGGKVAPTAGRWKTGVFSLAGKRAKPSSSFHSSNMRLAGVLPATFQLLFFRCPVFQEKADAKDPVSSIPQLPGLDY